MFLDKYKQMNCLALVGMEKLALDNNVNSRTVGLWLKRGEKFVEICFDCFYFL